MDPNVEYQYHKIRPGGDPGRNPGVHHYWWSYCLNKHYLTLDSVCSDNRTINIGVLQGSILGPLVVQFYVIDLPNVYLAVLFYVINLPKVSTVLSARQCRLM